MLDNFGARFDTSNLGRFMTPDWAAKPIAVPYAHYGNPQSLNLYSYVNNNPTTFGDPDGHGPWPEMGTVDCPTAANCQPNKQEQWGQQWLANAMKVAAQKAAQNNSNNQTQPQPGEEHKGEPYSAKQVGVPDSSNPDVKVYHYQIVDPSGKPIQGTSYVTEYVKTVFEIGEHDLQTAANVRIENGRFRDSVGEPNPSATGHDYFKTEQTFSVVQNGKTFILTTKVNQYVSVTNGRVTSEAVVVVP